MGSTIVLLHNKGEWGWADLERNLALAVEAGELYSADEISQAKQLVARTYPDVLITQPVVANESIAPFIGELRATGTQDVQIYLIDYQFDDELLSPLMRVGIDGVLLWEDLGKGNYQAYLSALVSDKIQVTSRGVSNLATLLHPNWRSGDRGNIPELSARQLRLLKLKYQDGRLTYKQLARLLSVSESTVRHEFEKINELFDSAGLLQLGVQAARAGLLP